ncbi:benzoate 4-monooxygenase cytochrome P450 [Amylocarpus encephaloides]|uniref:Benzoate 4-monooxygenase cytochrome P450 n=1 Tax=Amylocarpus encephaloides TaxID=45428 RepID=A0A9P8C276_9HELO|nr:benzoate 4-monooxygenase cytochrome P450 [Amylocarpus encephaloides]
MSNEIAQHWQLILLSTYACYLITSTIYTAFLGPLSKYPGPFLAKISALPSWYYSLKGTRHMWIWQCHQTYGDIVRFHPNGLLFNSTTAYRAMNGAKANVRKGTFYDVWTRTAGSLNTLNTTDRGIHARKRRILNAAFSDSTIRSAEAFIIKHVDRWCELLQGEDGEDWGSPKNMADQCDNLMFDTMADLSFGNSFEIKEPGEHPLRNVPKFIHGFVAFNWAIGQSPFVELWVWLKPRGLDTLLNRFSPKGVLAYLEFTRTCMKERAELETSQANELEEDKRKDLFHYLFKAEDPETGTPYTEEEVVSEAGLLIVAGSDTCSVVLSGFFFYLTQNPEVYEKLTAEIRGKFSSVNEIRAGGPLASCQYLRACIDEALRMCPPIPSDLPRVTLKGGAKIDNEFIPGGVRISSAIWSLHYNEEYFSDPFTFRPERWIVSEKVRLEDVSRANSALLPFSYGPGNCVGQRLAMMELSIILARTLFLMDVTVDRNGPGTMRGTELEESKGLFAAKSLYIFQREGPIVRFKRRRF